MSEPNLKAPVIPHLIPRSSDWNLCMDAMREDEEMRAGRDGTLFAKEHRMDAEMTRELHPKPIKLPETE